MNEWMGADVTLALGTIALAMLVGRLCIWVASWLPAVLEHQWQRDARELLGLGLGTPIDLRLPGASRPETWIVQTGCAGLSLVVIFHFGPSLQALFALLLTWCLLTLSLIDRRHHLLPDALVMPGLWAGLVLNSFGMFTTLTEAFWGCVIGYVSLWSVYHLVKCVTGKESMGAGDFKLLALIGAWGGWHLVPYTVAGSLLIAASLTVYLRLAENGAKRVDMPFGPSLSLAGWVVFIAGTLGHHVQR